MKINDLLSKLKNKYGAVVPLLQLLEKKYSAKESTETRLVLSNNIHENEKIINRLIDKADTLRNQLKLSDPQTKLFDRYVEKLKKIPDKKLMNGEELAKHLCNCVKSTILKLFAVENCRTLILNYLQENGFELNSYECGHRLSDDDLCLLDENLLSLYKEITHEPEENYQVIEMLQPVIKIFYLDEDDEKNYFQFIPGTCRYYVYVKEEER